MSSGFKQMLLLKIPAKQGSTKRITTIAQRNTLAFSYPDNNVAIFWSASEIVSVGKVHINSAFRARQSKLLTWSDNIAPATGNPAGRRISKG